MGVTMVMSAGVAWTLAKTTAWDRPGRDWIENGTQGPCRTGPHAVIQAPNRTELRSGAAPR
jgi:hypothetical protein